MSHAEVLSFCSESFGTLLEQVVEGLTRHVSDDSPNVRRLCLRGLVQVVGCKNTHIT